MPTPAKTRTNPPAEGAARLLHEILGSLVSELAKATAGRDLNEAHWRKVYCESSTLSQFEPSRVRILGATVSLPIAIHEIASGVAPSADLDADRLSALQEEARALPETRFLYRASDLEKLRPELILRMDLTLAVD